MPFPAIPPNLTDTGNAERFTLQHGKNVRYCPGVGWLLYDGMRWLRGDERIDQLAKKTARSIYSEAEREQDPDRRQKIGNWALHSESLGRIRAMTQLARCELLISADELDSDPWLLNCPNGTVDLRSQELRKHNPKDFITKITRAPYDPDASSSLFNRVLTHALPSEELQDYIQRCAGYTITGNVGEDVLFGISGPTRSSKGTIQEAFSSALGDYAITCELDILGERDQAGGPRPELTRLRGARMVSIYETSQRMKMSASLAKTLAGSDPITCRTLHKEPITFKPAAKIWLATNYLPKVSADDDALWERIRRIPFNVQLSEGERDPTVRARLLEEEHATAILNWAVDGCYLWQKSGLGQPLEVRAATASYRASMDSFQRFVNECCLLGPNSWTASRKIRESYQEWCRDEGETPIDSFQGKLNALGCTPKSNRHQGGRGWSGIAIQGDHLAVARFTKGGES